jgi:DNA polymerase-3 subunit chi
MTERVDFYVLPSAAPKQRWTFACRLTEKAYLRDLRIVILSDSIDDARALDDLLWTFNDRSFIPHQLCVDGQSMDPSAKVYLTAAAAASPSADLLVNLAARLPDQWERYSRIAEIIDADDERRRLGRERFKAYRDLKVPLETHAATREDPKHHG